MIQRRIMALLWCHNWINLMSVALLDVGRDQEDQQDQEDLPLSS